MDNKEGGRQYELVGAPEDGKERLVALFGVHLSALKSIFTSPIVPQHGNDRIARQKPHGEKNETEDQKGRQDRIGRSFQHEAKHSDLLGRQDPDRREVPIRVPWGPTRSRGAR